VKRFFLIVAIILPIMALAVGAEALGQRAERPPTVGYRLVREVSSPGTVIAPDHETGLAAVVDGADSVAFLGPSGKVIGRIEKTRSSQVFPSQDGRYLGIQYISGAQGQRQMARSVSFALYNRQGERLWSRVDPLGDDEPLPSWYVSNNGRVISVWPTKSRLRFLDRSGSVEKTVELFPDSPPEMERPIACAFSADGKWLAVNALDQYPRPGDEMTPRQRGQSDLILFTESGEELWRRRLEEEICGPVAVSQHGEMLAAVAFSVKGADLIDMRTHLYDDEGQELATVETAFRLADFSSDGARLLLSRKNDLRLVDTAAGKTIWEEQLPAEYGQIRAVDLSPDGALALAAAAPSHYRDGVFHFTPVHAFLYDVRGEIVWSEFFPEDEFDRPGVHFLPDGRGFTIALQDRYLTYEQEK
jgi:hypothetical protein